MEFQPNLIEETKKYIDECTKQGAAVESTTINLLRRTPRRITTVLRLHNRADHGISSTISKTT